MADAALATLETANETASTYEVSVRGPFTNKELPKKLAKKNKM